MGSGGCGLYQLSHTHVPAASFAISSLAEQGMMILDFESEECSSTLAGGKAHNLWRLGQSLEQCKVPPWFCLTTEAFQLFIQVSMLVSLRRLGYVGVMWE